MHPVCKWTGRGWFGTKASGMQMDRERVGGLGLIHPVYKLAGDVEPPTHPHPPKSIFSLILYSSPIPITNHPTTPAYLVLLKLELAALLMVTSQPLERALLMVMSLPL